MSQKGKKTYKSATTQEESVNFALQGPAESVVVPPPDLIDFVHSGDKYNQMLCYQILCGMMYIINKMPEEKRLPHMMKIYEMHVKKDNIINYAPTLNYREMHQFKKDDPIETLYSEYIDIVDNGQKANEVLLESRLRKDQ